MLLIKESLPSALPALPDLDVLKGDQNALAVIDYVFWVLLHTFEVVPLRRSTLNLKRIFCVSAAIATAIKLRRLLLLGKKKNNLQIDYLCRIFVSAASSAYFISFSAAPLLVILQPVFKWRRSTRSLYSAAQRRSENNISCESESGSGSPVPLHQSHFLPLIVHPHPCTASKATAQRNAAFLFPLTACI